MKNPNCDGTHCKQPKGEIRLLPSGGGGNMILCQDCYEHEMRFRRSENRRLSAEGQFDLPSWESLKMYKE